LRTVFANSKSRESDSDSGSGSEEKNVKKKHSPVMNVGANLVFALLTFQITSTKSQTKKSGSDSGSDSREKTFQV
jgi:hypothetical protein